MTLLLKFIKKVFKLREGSNYSIRLTSQLTIPRVNSVYHGTESASFLGPKIWDLVPLDIKGKGSLSSFKKAIKIRKPSNCPCRLCKTFTQNVGFL